MQALQSRVSSVRVKAFFSKGTKKTGTVKKAGKSGTERQGGAGYRRYENEALWLPNTERPGAYGSRWGRSQLLG